MTGVSHASMGDKSRAGEVDSQIMKGLTCRFKVWTESQGLGNYWCRKYRIALATTWNIRLRGQEYREKFWGNFYIKSHYMNIIWCNPLFSFPFLLLSTWNKNVMATFQQIYWDLEKKKWHIWMSKANDESGFLWLCEFILQITDHLLNTTASILVFPFPELPLSWSWCVSCHKYFIS